MSKLLAGDKENIRDRNQPTRLLSAADNSLKALGLAGIRRELNPSVQDKSARGIAKPTTVGKVPPQVSIQGLVQGGVIPYSRKVVKPTTKAEDSKDNLTKLRIGQVTSTNLGLIAAGLQKPSSNTNIPAQSTSTTRYQSKPKARKPEETQGILLDHKQSLLGSFHKAFPQAAVVSGAPKSQAVRRAKENNDHSSVSNTSEVSEVSRQRKGLDGKLNGASGEQLQTLTYKSTEATLTSLHLPSQGESLLANNAPTTKQKKLTTYNPAVLKKIGAFQSGALGVQKHNIEVLTQYQSGPPINGHAGIAYLKEPAGEAKHGPAGDKPKPSLGGITGIAATIKSKNSISLGTSEMSYASGNNLTQQGKGILGPSRLGNDSLLCNENIIPKYEILGGHGHIPARGVSNDPRSIGDKLFGTINFETASHRLAATKNFNPLHIKQKQLTPEEEIAAFEMKLKMDFGSPLPHTIQNLMKVEAEYSPDPYYLDKYHTEITWLERAILLDWLAEVSVFFVLKNSTYYLTVNYIDRYMTEVKNVEKSQFQLVGITALLIATKVEEIYVRPIAFLKDIAHNQFSTEAIMAMEISMMKVLKWKVHPPTLHILFNWYTTQWDLFLDTDPDCKMHPMIKHEPTLRLTFHELNHNSYNRYRELMQLLDCALLDVQTLQYKLHPLVAAFMYILLGKDFKQFTLEQITETFSQSSKYLLNKEFAFNNLFAIFMEKNFSFELEDLLPCIQYASTFFSLPLSMKLNPSLDVKALQNGPYEEFIAFQMHNEHALGFVTSVRKRDIYSQDYQ